MKSCQLCSKLFCSGYRLTTHICLVHTHEPNFILSCEYCSRTFQALSSYTAHISRVHRNKKEKNFVSLYCPHCDYICVKLSKLLLHLKKHMAVGVPVDCPYDNCNKFYIILSSLKSHILRCHTAENIYKRKYIHYESGPSSSNFVETSETCEPCSTSNYNSSEPGEIKTFWFNAVKISSKI